MRNQISLKADPQKTAGVLFSYILISLVLIVVFVVSVHDECMQLYSLYKSSYVFSVIIQEDSYANTYYQFDAGIDFFLPSESRKSINADIIMQTNHAEDYTNVVYWNAQKLRPNGIAISKNIETSYNLKLGDKLYSKHKVNDKDCEYTIEEIIPESLRAKERKDKRNSSGIIIMGYDNEYIDNIRHKCILFSDKPLSELKDKISGYQEDYIDRVTEEWNSLMRIVPYWGALSLIAISAVSVFVYLLSNSVNSNYRRMMILGFKKNKLNKAYCMFIYGALFISIMIALGLSCTLFLLFTISSVMIIVMIWIPFISIISMFIITARYKRSIWRK